MELLGALTLSLLIGLACLVLSTWRQQHRQSQMPPGPMPLPIIGNLLQVNISNILRSLMKLSKTYGPVFTIHLGPRRFVVLCGYDAVKEALVDQAETFSGRGEHPTFDWLFQGYGVGFNEGERVKQMRRFAIATLSNFGMGKRSIEDRILEEAQFLLEALRDKNGAPFDPTFVLSCSVSNVISSITLGERFDYDNQEFLSLLNDLLRIFNFTSSTWGQMYDMFSGVMRYLPGPQKKAFKHLAGLEENMVKSVRAHQETLDPNCPRDYIDCFLVKMQQEKDNPNTEFVFKNLVLSAGNIFFGGTETISTTLRYGFLILLKHPEIEEKVRQEIDRVIGRNRAPKLEDRPQMPYTEAVIHEIQRFADTIPLGMIRRVTRDTQLRGYTIPKRTEVFVLLGSVLRDPQHFARPEEFDPRHFLDESGRFKKSEAFMPFSAGKRICIGEPLARIELFLFFTSILQHFRLKSPVPPKDIDISPLLVGFSTIPRPYELCFIPR